MQEVVLKSILLLHESTSCGQSKVITHSSSYLEPLRSIIERLELLTLGIRTFYQGPIHCFDVSSREVRFRLPEGPLHDAQVQGSGGAAVEADALGVAPTPERGHRLPEPPEAQLLLAVSFRLRPDVFAVPVAARRPQRHRHHQLQRRQVPHEPRSLRYQAPGEPFGLSHYDFSWPVSRLQNLIRLFQLI